MMERKESLLFLSDFTFDYFLFIHYAAALLE